MITTSQVLILSVLWFVLSFGLAAFLLKKTS